MSEFITPNNIHLIKADLKYLQLLRNSNNIGLSVLSKFEYLLFKTELIEVAKIQEKITDENDFKDEFNDALNKFRDVRNEWLETHPNFQS